MICTAGKLALERKEHGLNAAIDHATRKLMNDGERPVSVGFRFALGHSSVVPPVQAVRAHAKTSLRLALALQHRRTANRQLAALCLEASSSTVAVISIIALPT